MKDNLKNKLQQQYSQHLLLKLLSGALTEENNLQKGTVHLPEYDLSIRPELNEVKHSNGVFLAVVYYHAHCPEFEEPFFECVMAAGSTLNEALEQAVSGFIFSAMCGIRHFLRREAEYELETTFGGRTLKWEVCKSCLALMGDEQGISQDGYWEIIREGLAGRMGNHRVNYIKVYAAKLADGTVTGECRINDIDSPELGALVAQKAAEWPLQEILHSQKQFFWLRQMEETYEPYPHTREQVREFTRQAVELFASCDNERYEHFTELLTEQIGDKYLAQELYRFLPELCAEHYFEQKGVTPAERLILSIGGKQEAVYKSNLTPYYWIRQRLLDGIYNGEISKETYRYYIGSSATYSSACKALEQNEDLSKCTFMTICPMDSDYKVR